MQKYPRPSTRKYIALALLVLLVAAVVDFGSGALANRSPAPPECAQIQVPPSSWPVPTCTRPSGQVPITFSCDEGKTLVPVKPAKAGSGIVDMVALDEPGALVALYGGQLFRKRRRRLHLDRDPDPRPLRIPDLASAHQGSWRSRLRLSMGSTRACSGLTVTDSNGFIDPGARRLAWEPIVATPTACVPPTAPGNSTSLSTPESTGRTLDRGCCTPSNATVHCWSTVEFDPSDPDHAIFVSAHESFVTRDGGQRWARLGTQPLALEFSPVDGKVVWAWGQHRSVALGGREASTSTPFPCPTRTA